MTFITKLKQRLLAPVKLVNRSKKKPENFYEFFIASLAPALAIYIPIYLLTKFITKQNVLTIATLINILLYTTTLISFTICSFFKLNNFQKFSLYLILFPIAGVIILAIKNGIQFLM